MRTRPYDLLAQRYDETEPKLLEWAARETARISDPSESDEVLDVGTGPGYAILAIPHVRKAVGVDRSPLMVKRATDAGIAARVADVSRLPFESSSFDLILATSVLALLSPNAAHWTEMSRVVRSGGRCVANFWLPVRDKEVVVAGGILRASRRVCPRNRACRRMHGSCRSACGRGTRKDDEDGRFRNSGPLR